MSMIMFHHYFPEVAEKETRSITLFRPQDGLPAGCYGFIEFYCNDPRCDCRRVMLNVVKPNQQEFLAVISYGFDADDPQRGPFLDPLNRQGPLAPALLKLAEKLLLNNSDYLERLERHYRMVKDAVGTGGKERRPQGKETRRRWKRR